MSLCHYIADMSLYMNFRVLLLLILFSRSLEIALWQQNYRKGCKEVKFFCLQLKLFLFGCFNENLNLNLINKYEY